MIKKNSNSILFGLLFILSGTICIGQIVDFNNQNPYKKVFVDTDNFGASYLDILQEAVDKVENDTIKFSMLNDLAYYWHTRNLNEALNFTKKGLNLTKEKNNLLWEGRFQITQGAILLRMEKLNEAVTVLEEAKKKVNEADLPFLNTQLGYVFERQGRLDIAANYALETRRLGEQLNDNRAIAVAFSDLSNIFWKQSKFEKGLEFGLRSAKLFEDIGINDLDYDFTLYVIGNNYLALKNYEQALNYFQHSIAIGERYGFHNNLSDVYISLVDLNVYLNQFEKAETAGENAIKYAELLGNNFMLMRSWLSIGKMQNLQGKYISAIESIERSIVIAGEDFGDKYYLSQAYEVLGKAYAFNHNYKDALSAFEEYDRLKNEIFTAEADHRISLIQTEFDVAGKEDTIELQEITIERQRVRQTLFIVFASLLFILLLLIYIAYQNIRKKRVLLQKQNLEKEFLLKEIHHRVKNNLGVVSSLLELQAAKNDDPKVIEAMKQSQNRVYSMGMIHQRLYQGKNLATVEMKSYFQNLGQHILDSFGVVDRVNIEFEMEAIEIDVDTAIPLGLIVNELLTNSLKYAFPNERKGEIKISLQKTTAEILLLEVADDGVGKQEENLNKGTGFGTQLIKLLMQQLDGEMKFQSKEGTSFSFEFNLGKAA
ncbi:MAG: histidine kinase dimerization/phosphoacceptor domain -containing protein [Aureibaculum sp.]|nr:histidine kinase dimerization/phosphoacceptor domain -containing protein [Aureibaculum sp.]